MLDKFAEELHEAREKAGISLQQMATRTRVDIKFLEAIDRGDFTFLSEPYVKAFIKDYARIVGLDENKTIQKYESAKRGKQVELQSQTTAEETETKPEPFKKVHHYDATPPPGSSESSATNKNILLAGVIAGILIITAALIFFVFDDSDEIVIEEKPIEEIIEDQQRFEEPEDNFTTGAEDSLTLIVLSGDTSWVQIIYDEKTSEEFTLFPGSQKSIKAGKDFKITLGNSGAITFQLNGKPLNFKGREGTVAYIRVNKDGFNILESPPSL
jgi:hypothetical protein